MNKKKIRSFLEIPAAVLLCIFLTTFSANAATVKKQVVRLVDISPESKLTIVSRYSSIYVQTWASEQVRIEADLVVSGHSYRDAQQFLDKIQILIDELENNLSVRSKLPQLTVKAEKAGFFESLFNLSRDYSVDITFRVFVPDSIDLDITTTDGSVEVDNVSGTIQAMTSEGPIRLNRVRGPITAYTTNAGIVIFIADPEVDDIELSTTNADIELNLPGTAHIDVQARSIGGAIKSEFPLLQYGPFTDEVKYGWINGGGNRALLNTTNGDIEIKRAR
ncbi:DUF4097 domain-containing protein [candidate division KSB1 bacterium]